MFAEHPVTPRDEQGRPRSPTKDEIAGIEKLVEVETLEREVYGLWGVKLDVESTKAKKPIEVYETPRRSSSRVD